MVIFMVIKWIQDLSTPSSRQENLESSFIVHLPLEVFQILTSNRPGGKTGETSRTMGCL